ncbi:hypothetical protein FACS189415_3290 [Bacteroidia bacterium]|nr:hypothetical protein FACS189415_3290 [Bacteroidia bacterium]
MNNRLTISEISGLLVQSTGKDNAQIEQFLQEFVSVVRDNLFADRLVQIKGIGNFKIILVEKRESIDVNTKERIVIPEHYKLSFLPDKDMREVVNKPFSFFESIEIADGESIPVLPETELPDDDKEDDLDDGSIIDEKELIETPAQRVVAQSVTNVIEEFPPLPVVPEPIEEPIPVIPEPVDEIPHLPEPEPEEKIQQLPIVEEVIEDVQDEEPLEGIITEDIPTSPPPIEDTNTYEFDNETNNNNLTEEKESIEYQLIDEKMAENNENGTNRPGYYKQPGNNNTVIILLAAVVLVLLVAGTVLVIKNKDAIFGGDSGTVAVTKTTDKADDALFALPPERDDSSIDEEWGEATADTDVAGTTHVKAPASSNKTKVSGTSATAISSTPKGKAKAKATAPRKKGPTTQQTSVTVRNGDRLNLYALRFYGNKVFWVYIYQANQSKLSNPDIIPVGVTLTIPASSTYQIDSYNPASVKKAFALQTQILARFKGNNANPYGLNSYGGGQQGYDQYGGGQYGSGQYGNSQSGQYGGGQYGGAYGGSTSGQYGGQYSGSTGGQYGGSYDPYGTGGQYGNSLNDPTAAPFDDPFGDIPEYDDDYGNGLFNSNQSSTPAKSSGSAKKQSTTTRRSNSNVDDYGNSYNSGSQPKKKSSGGGSLGGYL